MSSYFELPPEIWLQIFRWATVASSTHEGYAITYEPFQTSSGEALEAILQIKQALVLVCRAWRALASQFLFEDVRIRHGAEEIHRVQEATKDGDHPYGCGRWVKRAVLPYSSTVTQTYKPLTSLAVLKNCPNIEFLVRPGPLERIDNLRFEFSAESLPLPSLKRLEWWHYNDAARSGGINSLEDVLRDTPDLRYLSVGGELWLSLVKVQPLCLPALTTLRLRRMNGLFLRQICRWSLPALTHVIADSPVSHRGLETLYETFGSQLATIEFGKNLRFIMDDNITPTRACPNLRELNYYIHFTTPPRLWEHAVHPSLTRIGLHAHWNSFVPDGDWTHLEEHFALFSGQAFPSLERIVLYGPWQEIVRDSRFAPLGQSVFKRGCAIESSDGKILLF